MSDRESIFRVIETADNFLKYASPGRESRAALRARRRYEKAMKLAQKSGDDYLVDQVRLRLADLERREVEPRDQLAAESDDEPDVVESALPPHAAERVPPRQRVTRGWPVLHEGPIPRFTPDSWRFTVTGACRNELAFTYDELKALPNARLTADFHCVTGWTKLDNEWLGVRVKGVIDDAMPAEDAAFVSVAAEYGYTANVPISVLREDDALLTWGHNGKDLAPRHGYPLRLVLPRLYGWKSVKWVRSLELLTADRRGFWEVRGYHNGADPWLEQRYSYQE